jgi:hypothetical protein
MDIGRAFSYVTEDESWISKILIGGLIALIPVVGWLVVLGWVVQIARNVMQGVAKPIPDWSDFGEKLSIGFGAFVVQFVYSLPLLVVYCASYIVTLVVASMASGSDSGAAGAIAGLVGLVFLLLFLAAIAVTIPFTLVGAVRYVQTGNIGASIRFSEALTTVRNNLGLIGQLFLGALVGSLVGSLGSIACGIGMIFTLPFGQAIYAHVLGQAASRLSGGAPVNFGQPTPPTYTPPPTFQ